MHRIRMSLNYSWKKVLRYNLLAVRWVAWVVSGPTWVRRLARVRGLTGVVIIVRVISLLRAVSGLARVNGGLGRVVARFFGVGRVVRFVGLGFFLFLFVESTVKEKRLLLRFVIFQWYPSLKVVKVGMTIYFIRNVLDSYIIYLI